MVRWRNEGVELCDNVRSGAYMCDGVREGVDRREDREVQGGVDDVRKDSRGVMV